MCRCPRMRGRAIISILPSLVRVIEDETVFRVYVCESLHLAPQDKYLTAKYAEIITPKKAESRSPDELAADIIRKAGLSIEPV